MVKNNTMQQAKNKAAADKNIKPCSRIKKVKKVCHAAV
jgi:hypothetical protein